MRRLSAELVLTSLCRQGRGGCFESGVTRSLSSLGSMYSDSLRVILSVDCRGRRATAEWREGGWRGEKVDKRAVGKTKLRRRDNGTIQYGVTTATPTGSLVDSRCGAV